MLVPKGCFSGLNDTNLFYFSCLPCLGLPRVRWWEPLVTYVMRLLVELPTSPRSMDMLKGRFNHGTCSHLSTNPAILVCVLDMDNAATYCTGAMWSRADRDLLVLLYLDNDRWKLPRICVYSRMILLSFLLFSFFQFSLFSLSLGLLFSLLSAMGGTSGPSPWSASPPSDESY